MGIKIIYRIKSAALWLSKCRIKYSVMLFSSNMNFMNNSLSSVNNAVITRRTYPANTVFNFSSWSQKFSIYCMYFLSYNISISSYSVANNSHETKGNLYPRSKSEESSGNTVIYSIRVDKFWVKNDYSYEFPHSRVNYVYSWFKI